MKHPSLLPTLAALGIAATAAALLIPRLLAQSSSSGGSGSYSGSSGSYGSGSGSYTTYIQSAPAASLQVPGYLNFQVPVSRAGHSFSVRYKVAGNPNEQNASGTVMGLATAQLVAGGPQTQIFLAVAVPPPSSPFNPADFWLVDTSAIPNQSAAHRTYGLVNAEWRAISGVTNQYFTIPSSRLGHSLLVGSAGSGWVQLTQGQLLGSFSTQSGVRTYQSRLGLRRGHPPRRPALTSPISWTGWRRHWPFRRNGISTTSYIRWQM